MSTRGLPPLFGAPWERDEEAVQRQTIDESIERLRRFGVSDTSISSLKRLAGNIIANARSRAPDYLFDQLISFGADKRDVVTASNFDKTLISEVVGLQEALKRQFLDAYQGHRAR